MNLYYLGHEKDEEVNLLIFHALFISISVLL